MKTHIKCISFDFDGTLVDTNLVKGLCYKETCEKYKIDLEHLRQVHLALPGESRYGIFTELLKREGRSEIFTDVIETINALIEDGVRNANYIPGAEELLKELSDIIPLYVNSATPEEPLRQSVEDRKMQHYFKGVYGKPKSKEEILTIIKNETGLEFDQILMVGDGINDYQAAQNCGCPFLGIHFNEWSRVKDIQTLKVPDLTTFDQYFSY